MGINEYIKIGSRIKQIRIEKGLSQKEMASKIGIPVSTYSNYENDYREPNSTILENITDVLGISFKELLSNYDEDDKLKYFYSKMINSDNSNEFNGAVGAINELMKSVGCFIETQDNKYLIYSPHYEAFLVPKEDIDWLEDEMKDYLLFRIDKLYRKHYDEIEY